MHFFLFKKYILDNFKYNRTLFVLYFLHYISYKKYNRKKCSFNHRTLELIAAFSKKSNFATAVRFFNIVWSEFLLLVPIESKWLFPQVVAIFFKIKFFAEVMHLAKCHISTIRKFFLCSTCLFPSIVFIF